MAFEKPNELLATPPKLTLTSLPSNKPLPPTPGTLTPPLQPMVSIPFLWEEVPGRARHFTISSPCKPSTFRRLELPPRMSGSTSGVPKNFTGANTPSLSSSPTTVLDEPKVGRTLSHRFFLEDVSPKGLGSNDGPDLRKCEIELRRSDFGPWRWASGNGTKWGEMQPNVDFTTSWHKSRSIRSDVDIEGRMTRFRRRTKGSLYKLSHKSTSLLENIYQGLKQMVLVRKCKECKKAS